MLCFYCTQTHMKLQSEFSRELKKTTFARLPPLASAALPHPPRYASATQMLLNQDVEILQMYITLTMNAIYSSRAVPARN